MGSVKTRKVSTQSLQSTVSAEDTALTTFVNIDDTAAAAAAAVPDTPYDEQGQDTQTDLRDASDELEYCRNMPWIKVLYDGSVLLVDEGLRRGLKEGAEPPGYCVNYYYNYNYIYKVSLFSKLFSEELCSVVGPLLVRFSASRACHCPTCL